MFAYLPHCGRNCRLDEPRAVADEEAAKYKFEAMWPVLKAALWGTSLEPEIWRQNLRCASSKAATAS